jgi:4-hydroxy-3-methylbut-2-enyl diphosphate reductase
MEIILAKRSGFCFGVKRAVDIAFDMAKHKKNVFTVGPIIHNPQVIEKLKQEGIHPTEEPTKDMDAVIIRTHGVTVQMQEKMVQMGLEIVDATCPFVKKAQQYAKLLNDEGYQVVILGESDHPEVRSILSYSGEDAIVVGRGEIPEGLKSRVGIVVQTTQSFNALKELLSIVVEKTKEFKVYNTICNSTALRQIEAAEISKKVDVMIVIGGKNSANTTRLANQCKTHGVITHHIETAAEVENDWLHDRKTVGITAGASTPVWIIEEVIDKIKNI